MAGEIGVHRRGTALRAADDEQVRALHAGRECRAGSPPATARVAAGIDEPNPEIRTVMANAAPMRIALVGTRGPGNYGGLETCVAELAPRLADRGHAVTVYARRWC